MGSGLTCPLEIFSPEQRRALIVATEEERKHAYKAFKKRLKLMRLDDAREGVRAFIEGRPPRWTGR